MEKNEEITVYLTGYLHDAAGGAPVLWGLVTWQEFEQAPFGFDEQETLDDPVWRSGRIRMDGVNGREMIAGQVDGFRVRRSEIDVDGESP